MSYEKQTWTTGDIITAEKLNHIENGIENNGPLVVNATISNDIITLDKTWQEIYDAFPNAYYILDNGIKIGIIETGIEDDIYFVIDGSGGLFATDSSSGYPSTGK